jgi:hypothetical protein
MNGDAARGGCKLGSDIGMYGRMRRFDYKEVVEVVVESAKRMWLLRESRDLVRTSAWSAVIGSE